MAFLDFVTRLSHKSSISEPVQFFHATIRLDVAGDTRGLGVSVTPLLLLGLGSVLSPLSGVIRPRSACGRRKVAPWAPCRGASHGCAQLANHWTSKLFGPHRSETNPTPQSPVRHRGTFDSCEGSRWTSSARGTQQLRQPSQARPIEDVDGLPSSLLLFDLFSPPVSVPPRPLKRQDSVVVIFCYPATPSSTQCSPRSELPRGGRCRPATWQLCAPPPRGPTSPRVLLYVQTFCTALALSPPGVACGIC